MLKKTLSTIITFALFACVHAQEKEEFKPHGKVEGRIFTNFNADVTGDGETKEFELKRAYLGYSYQITPELKAKIKLDVGGSEFIQEDVESQYAYFKTAAVYYEKDNWFVAFGLHDTYHFKVQEKLWGKRYVLPSMLDKQKFDFSADIGASAAYHFDNVSVDFSLFNGEGYKQLQQDDAFRAGLGVTGYLLNRKIILRGYSDYSSHDVHLASYTGFIGLDMDKWSLGAEYTFQKNYDYMEGHDRNAYSLFGQYNFTPKFGVWARVDGISSDFVSDEDPEYVDKWQEKDGTYFYPGVEYIIVPKHLKASLNYHHHVDDTASNSEDGQIFFNIEVRF